MTAMQDMSGPAKLSSQERTLRLITIWSWFAAFPLNLSHGITAHDAFPAVGLIPATISSIWGLAVVMGVAKHPKINLLIDLSIAAAFLALLIPTWVFMAQGRWWDPGPIMLGCYATVPLMLNFVIHAYYFLIRCIPTYLLPAITCPHCHSNLLHKQGSHGQAPLFQRGRMGSIDSKDSYDPVTMVDNDAPVIHVPQMSKKANDVTMIESSEPRPSTDDEAARLV